MGLGAARTVHHVKTNATFGIRARFRRGCRPPSLASFPQHSVLRLRDAFQESHFHLMKRIRHFHGWRADDVYGILNVDLVREE